MVTGRRCLSIATAVLCLAGLAQAVRAADAGAAGAPTMRASSVRAAAEPAVTSSATAPGTATIVRPAAIVCSATVTLGSTTPCTFGASGGTAEYTFTSPGADIIRFRNAVLSSPITQQATLSTAGGTALCTVNYGSATVDCQIPNAGTYRLDVTVAQATTVYTSIDGVLGDSCQAAPDLSVGSPGIAANITQPGGSYCAELPVNAPAKLELLLDSQGDAGLDISVYDGALHRLCHLTQVTPFARSQCDLTSTNAFRVFWSGIDDALQDTTLLIYRVSDPTGCSVGTPDAFGQNPSRRGTLTPHQAKCYGFTGTAGQRVGVHLLGTTGTLSTLQWTLRDADGTARCSGNQGGFTVSPCLLLAAGQYAVFVTTLARQDGGYALSVTDLASSAGCQPVASTAWDASTEADSWAHTGEVDCHSFTVGAAAHSGVRAALFADQTHAQQGVVLAADGTNQCTVPVRVDCALPAGSYRMITSTNATGATPYRIQVTDLSSSAGCTPTTPDAMGTGPTRTAELGADHPQACWSFTGPAGAAYFVNSAGLDGLGVDIGAEVRSLDGSSICVNIFGPCRLPAAGTYLLVMRRSTNGSIPTQDENSTAGIWRLDRPTSCATIGTSFTSPVVHGNIATPLELDCHQFGGTAGDRVQVRNFPDDYSVVGQIFAADGSAVCGVVNSTCTLTGPAPYRLVTYAFGAQTRIYKLRVASLSRGAGCAQLAILPFGRAPGRAFSIDDVVDLDCYRITRTSALAGRLKIRQVAIDGPSSARVDVYNATTGAYACTSFDNLADCVLPAGAGDYLLVLSADAAGTSGKLGVYDATTTQGCRAGPSLAFGTDASPGRIVGRGALDCIDLSAAAARDYLRESFGPHASDVRFYGTLVDRTGFRYCSIDSSGGAGDCHLPSNAAGPFRLLTYADDRGPTFVGSYRIHVWRLNDPTGCTDLGSLRTGFGPLVGTLADPHDEACYLGDARTGTFAVTTSNDDVPTDVPTVQFLRSTGNRLDCSVTGSGNCMLIRGGTKTIIVRNFDADFSGHYRVVGECTTTRCGP